MLVAWSPMRSRYLIAVAVYLIVGGKDTLCEFNVAADYGVEGVAHHLLGEFAHTRQIDVGLHARVAKDAQGALGDVDGLIADALEIVIDARDSQHEAEIDGHELVQREKLNNAIVNFHLELVDGVFFLKDALGELFIGFQNGVNGLVNGALREAAHPEQALFHFVQIFFEVAFHPVLFCLKEYSNFKFSLRISSDPSDKAGMYHFWQEPESSIGDPYRMASG